MREKADENNDDIEQQQKKYTNNSNIKIVKIELKLMCNHVVACAHTQGPISHLSYSKRKKQNAEKIVNRRAWKVEIETRGAIVSSFFLSKCHIRLAFNAPFNSDYHV